MRIEHVEAQTIPDTRGRLTIETTFVSGDVRATASVPSGKSTGKHEAVELDAAQAVENVNGEIATALAGREFSSLDELDDSLIALDGTRDKARLGANAILSVSIAAQRLSALQNGVPLWEAIAKRSGFALAIAQKAFGKLGEMLGADTPMGDEGGYAPTFDTLERPFELLADLVEKFPGTSIAIDAAASQLFHDGTYRLLEKAYSSEELSHVYEELVAHFPLESIEDPFDENAHDDFARFTSAIGGKIVIVGDDLTCTNPERIRNAASHKEINAVLIKPNQIGTVREALEAVRETYAAGFKAIASHRSGETADTFIADFAYGIGAYGLKAGGFAQPERLLKYDRLLAIEHEARHTPSVSGEAESV
ncbi:MAG: Isoform 2 of Beta-enolase [Parcubacteria group bacterium GW2011_GWB1_55_9]|nr:MAG: Isoform 2 of Beta-enolase [Parcubacteria group bacterium GW2011_GWB1_55_9]